MSFIIILFVTAPLLMLTLWLIAGRREEYEFNRVVGVAAGLALGYFVVDMFLFELLGYWTLLPKIALALWVLYRFLYLSIIGALLVVIVWNILTVVALSALSSC